MDCLIILGFWVFRSGGEIDKFRKYENRKNSLSGFRALLDVKKTVPFHYVREPSLKRHQGFLRFNYVTFGRQKDLFWTLLKLSDCYVINECSEGGRGKVKILLLNPNF